MSQLPALLRTDLSQMAERVRRAGRGRDTVLAHITPQEAALLRARGGSGTPNPATGLPEFLTFEEANAEQQQEEKTFYPPVQGIQLNNDPGEGAFQYPAPPIIDGSQGAGVPTEISFPATENFPFPQYPEKQFDPQAIAQIERSAPGARDLKQEMMERGFAETRDLPIPAQRLDIERALRQAMQTGGEFLKTPFGYGAIGGIPALLQARRAARQAQGMREELGRLGQEARTQGQQLVAQARAGQVTAAQQQALDAQRAAAMQNLSRRGITGGTAVQQMERSLQDQKGRFLEDTLNQGMRLLNVGDQYTERAIRAQYAADAQAQQLLGNFFQNYMRVLAGQTETTTPRTTTRSR
jgi:hypothetical protein